MVCNVAVCSQNADGGGEGTRAEGREVAQSGQKHCVGYGGAQQLQVIPIAVRACVRASLPASTVASPRFLRLRQRAAEMEDELEKTKQSYQTQTSTHEKKAHNNWVSRNERGWITLCDSSRYQWEEVIEL